jgi:hypothetical protein
VLVYLSLMGLYICVTLTTVTTTVRQLLSAESTRNLKNTITRFYLPLRRLDSGFCYMTRFSSTEMNVCGIF